MGIRINMKISKLSKKERNDICLNHYIFNCYGCPLKIDGGYCYSGVIENLAKAKKRVAKLKKLLQSVKDKEVIADVKNN